MSYEASQSSLIPNTRNSLAPRGGLAFDGTVGGKGIAAITNQSIGTDAFSVSLVFNAPAYAGTTKMLARLSGVSNGSGGAGSALTIYVDTALTFHFRNAAHDGYIQGAVDFTPYYGKVVHVVGVRSGTTFAIYINGTNVAFTPSSGGNSVLFSQNLVTTYFEVGGYITTSVPVSAIYAASLYNLPLTQADVTEIYELGGAAPERFKFGTSTTNYGPSDFSAGVDGWWTGDSCVLTANIDTNADAAGQPPSDDWLRGVQATTTLAPRIVRLTFLPAAHGKCYRVKGEVMTPTGSGLVFVEGLISGSNGPMTPQPITPGASSTFLIVGVSPTGANGNLEIYASKLSGSYGGAGSGSGSTGTNKAYWKNVSISRAGAVVHYDGFAGVGYQLHDQSTNKLHALLTTTGVAWTNAVTMGSIKALSDGTTAAQALGGGTVIPATSQIVRIRARSLSGTPSITLGTSSGGSQIVASVALSTTWKDLTIALTGGINITAASLWMTASAANVVEVQLAYEQLPA